MSDLPVNHPGYWWAVSPTRDWKKPAPNAFHWAAYSGNAGRYFGFAETAAEAKAAARRALRPAERAES